MEEIIKQLFIRAKSDRGILQSLKKAAVDACMYEEAAMIRQFEKEHYPEKKEAIEAEEFGEQARAAFALTGMNVGDARMAWIIMHTAIKFLAMRGDFDLKTAAEIKAKAKEYFGA